MDDYPIAEIPDTPNWAENFCLAGYDPGSGIDVYLHIGRWRKDRRLWRELVAIRLPDNTVIAHRAIGNGRAGDRSPGGPNMGVRILEPGRHFEWDFLGGARRVPADYLRDNILDDGPLSRVQFTFDYVADLPAWDLGTAGEGSAMVGHGHVEQIGRARAEISVDGELFHFDSAVNRDHSRGPRVLGKLYGHLWMQGILSDGTCFHCYEAQEGSRDNTVMSAACVIIGGELKQAQLEVGYHLPPQDALAHIQDEIPFKLTWEDGSIAGRVTSFPATVFCQFTSPSDSYIGARQIDEGGNSRYIQQALSFTLDDGRQGYGHAERTVPGKTIADPA